MMEMVRNNIKLRTTVVMFILGISGCASTGGHDMHGEKISDIREALGKGSIRLTCGLACSGAYGYNRQRLRSLYDNAIWYDLARMVTDIGHGGDQSYFYLGRAAEGLGYIDAARTYYALAKAGQKCGGLINVCDGLVFPRDIDNRLQNLPSSSGLNTIADAVKNRNQENPTREVATQPETVRKPDGEPATRTPDIATKLASTEPHKSGAPLENAKPEIKPPLEIKYESEKALLHDIDRLITSPLIKGSLETNLEFSRRFDDLIGEFKDKAYNIKINISNPENNKDGLAYYNPENGEFVISLPRVKSELIWTKLNGKRELKWLYASYLGIKNLKIDADSYKGSNKLGVSVKVTRIERVSHGVFVLTAATKDYSQDTTQRFSLLLKRDEARDLLNTGVLSLYLALDTRYLEDDETPLLFSEKYEHTPTMDKPLHLKDTKIGVPVRLLSIALLNGRGDELLKAAGQHVTSTAIRE